jgi:hypothetical protein
MYFARVEWSDYAARKLQNALACDAEIIRQQCENKIAALWSINGGESFMVVRREYESLVVVAYEGESLREAAPHIITAARNIGCTSIRFHTNRPAMLRLLREYNPQPVEYVCIVPIERVN